METAGKLKQAGLSLLKVEQERLEGMTAQKKEADDDVDEGKGEGEVGEGEGKGKKIEKTRTSEGRGAREFARD